MSGGHAHAIRVYYEDTDAGGIVYHANYLRFAERARTEWLRAAGFDHPTLLSELGVAFTVRRCDITFLAPAGLDDEIEVRTRLLRTQGARIHLEQIILRCRERLATLAIELVIVDRQMRPVRPPVHLRTMLRSSAAP